MTLTGHDDRNARTAKPWMLLVVIGCTLPMVAIVLLRARTGLAQTVGDITILAAAILAVFRTFSAARRGGPNRRGWLLMGVAVSIWASAQLLWTVYGLTRNHVYPFPALPDVGYIGYSVVAAAALLQFPRASEHGISRSRVILDALVIAASVLIISWVLVLSAVADSGDFGLAQLTSFGYPFGDVLVGSFVLALGMRVPTGARRPWLCLGVGLLVLTITDSIYVARTAEGVTGSTGSALAIGWTAAFVMIAVASQLRSSPSTPAVRHHFHVVQELLPYVPLVAAIAITHDRRFGADDPILMAGGALLLVLFVVQQVLIAKEKVQLADGLEDVIATRTAELTSSDARFRSLIRSSEDAIVAKSTTGIVTDWNPAAERLYGYTASEIVGRTVEMIIPEHLHDEERETRAALAAGRMVPNYETERIRKDGSVVSVSLTTSPIYDGRSVSGVSAISHDITARKLQEAELADARDAALEASRAKSEFLATMSHEIRTPMNGVIGLTELLLDTPLDHVQRRYAAGVRGAGEALLSIIDDILDFSKLEAGKIDLEAADYDPRELVEEVGVLLATTASGKGIELTAYCDPAVPVALLGDPGRLRQILINLTSNAIKFTEEGEVSLHVRMVTSSGDADRLQLVVADTGIGIDPADQARMFEPFSQADASTTRRFGGTGLGLAICRRLADAMGGDLTLESRLGHGTTFRCTLPTEARPGVAQQSAPSPALLTGQSVLVVDENETNRFILQTQLRAWGMRPVLAVDGASALRMLREAATDGSPYPFAILDWCMPGMDGVEVATTIAGDVALRSTRTMLLSSAGSVDSSTAAAAGLVTCINKPVRLSELHDSLVLLAGDVAMQSPAIDVLEPSSLTAGRVLVVEDNLVNQMVAAGVLRKLGYSVEVVGNGLHALTALEAGGYDAVLMDCHMPEMDGFQATAEWRRREGAGARLPIVAMTAGVLAEDRDRCFAAGMDDFVPKPIDVELLKRTLAARIVRRAPHVSAEKEAPPASIDTPTIETPSIETSSIDMARLDTLRLLGPDDGWGLLPILVQTFLAESPGQRLTIHDAASSCDPAAVARESHKLKGAAANLGAERLATLCGEIELAARAGSADPAAGAITRLDVELARASSALVDALSGRA